MNFLFVFGKMVELFLIVVIGYICNKCKLFGKEARVHVTKLVLNVTMPAMILASVLTQNNLPSPKQIVWLMLVAFSSYGILLIAAIIIPWLLRVKREELGIYKYMVAFGNVGFIGFPVTQAIFGDGAAFYTCVFNLPFNLLAFSLGAMFIQNSAALQKGETTEGQKFSFSWKILLTPGLISSVLAIVFALINFKGPAPIGETCTIVGNVTTPAALLIIGSSLAEMPVKEMFVNKRIYIFAVCRLLLLPFLAFALYRLFVTDMLLLGECVVITAMPVATNGTMFCLQYGCDEKLMAQGTFITTVASLLTIPLMAMLFI